MAQDQRVLRRRQRGVEIRERLQRGDARLHQQRQQGNPVRRLFVELGLVVEALAEGVDVGDVGFVAMRDMGHVDPRGMQARPRDALDARQGHAFDRAEFGEVDDGDFRQAAALGRAGAAERRLDVFDGDAALLAAALYGVEVEPELARQPPHGGPGVDAGKIGERGAGQGRHGACRRGSRGRLRGGRRSSGRRCSGRGCRRARAGFLHARDQRPHRQFIADFDEHLGDRSRMGRGHVHRRLVRLQRQQRLVGLHHIARLDENFDHRHVPIVADVRHFHVDFCHACLSPRASPLAG